MFGQACVKGHAEFSAHWHASPMPTPLPESLIHEDAQGWAVMYMLRYKSFSPAGKEKNVPERPFSSHFQLVQNCYYLFLVAWGSRTKRWAGEHSNLTDQSRGRAQASITSRDVRESFEVAGLFMALLRKVSLGGSHSSSGSVITWVPSTRPGPCVLNEYSLTEGSTDSLEVFIDADVSYTVN